MEAVTESLHLGIMKVQVARAKMKDRARELAEILTQNLLEGGMPEFLEPMVYDRLSDVLRSERFRAFLAANQNDSAAKILDKLVLRLDPNDFRVDLEYKN